MVHTDAAWEKVAPSPLDFLSPGGWQDVAGVSHLQGPGGATESQASN